MFRENLFRLFSLTALGLVSLFVAGQMRTDTSKEITMGSDPAQLTPSSPDDGEGDVALEQNSLDEVESINSGRFRPYEIGTLSAFD